MTIFLYPSRTTEGAVYARMLSIELGQAGMENLIYDRADRPEGEMPWVCRELRCALALVDTSGDGYGSLARLLREEGIPVLFYGYARPSEEDGGTREAFFPRPVRISELTARCEALLEASAADPLYLGKSHRECAYGGRLLHLTPIEYRVLSLLHSRAGETVDRQTLYEMCWPVSHEAEAAPGARGAAASNVVDACLRNLRKKLDEPLGRRLLYSVRGIGYRYADRMAGEDAVDTGS